LPPAAIYFAVAGGAARWRTLAKGLAIPIACYAAWSVFVRIERPGLSNPLFYYPILRKFGETLPEGQGLVDILRSLPAEHYRDLLWNRVLHLRHYLWASNPWYTHASESFRSVSLPSTLGFVLTIALLRPRVWMVGRAFIWLSIVGPLLALHAHIGQSFPQFHIFPIAFLALAAMSVNALSGAPAWIVQLALAECFLRQAFPFAFLAEDRQRAPMWFGGDVVAAYTAAFLPLAIWIWILAWTVRQREARRVSEGR
jgi:hypothetical protein